MESEKLEGKVDKFALILGNHLLLKVAHQKYNCSLIESKETPI